MKLNIFMYTLVICNSINCYSLSFSTPGCHVKKKIPNFSFPYLRKKNELMILVCLGEKNWAHAAQPPISFSGYQPICGLIIFFASLHQTGDGRCQFFLDKKLHLIYIRGFLSQKTFKENKSYGTGAVNFKQIL